MTKQINQDIASFKDDFFKGMSLRECIYGLAAVSVGAGVILLLLYVFQFQINAAVTVAIPFVAMIALCGFYERNGMTLPVILKRQICLIRQKPLVYRSVDPDCLFRTEPEAGKEKGLEGVLNRMEKKRQKKPLNQKTNKQKRKG